MDSRRWTMDSRLSRAELDSRRLQCRVVAIWNLRFANARPTVEWCLKDLGFEPVQISILEMAAQSYESESESKTMGFVTFNTYQEAEACYSALNRCKVQCLSNIPLVQFQFSRHMRSRPVSFPIEGPSLVGGGCSSLACRLCMLPVTCLGPMAQAAGAVSASRRTCTASSLAPAQQYGTLERHKAEIKLLRYRRELMHNQPAIIRHTDAVRVGSCIVQGATPKAQPRPRPKAQPAPFPSGLWPQPRVPPNSGPRGTGRAAQEYGRSRSRSRAPPPATPTSITTHTPAPASITTHTPEDDDSSESAAQEDIKNAVVQT